MTGNKEFQERLQRLGQNTDASAAPRPTRPAPRPRAHASSGVFSTNGALFGLIAIALAGAAYFYAQYHTRTHPMQSLASSYLAQEKPPQVSELTGLFAASPTDNAHQRSCISFLPAAPEGWVRVNTWDTKYPALLPKLGAIWQASGKSLEDALAYQTLVKFINRYGPDDPNLANSPTIRTLSSVLYINVELGSFLGLEVHSQPWRGAKTCRQEFLNHWRNFDPTEPPRHQVFKQFNLAQITYSPTGVPPKLRDQGMRNIYAKAPVSAGLDITVQGVAHAGDLRRVLNGDDIAQKAEAALAAPAS